MGTRVAVVIGATSFLLGSLFTHWIADSLTLWKPAASAFNHVNLHTAATYYHIISKGPSLLVISQGFIAALGAFSLLWCFRDGEAVNLMFDGGSIFLFGMACAVYIGSVLPAIYTQFNDVPQFASLMFPEHLRNAALDTASNNLMCSVALTGVLVLQAGRHWAEQADDDDEESDALMAEAS